MTEDQRQTKLNKLAVIAELDDGTTRQVMVSSDACEHAIIQVIIGCEGSIKVSNSVLEGISISNLKKEV